MARTAIVTLSCPHCGGRTDGLRSLEAPQIIQCPYCRSELHVPRVGDRVVERERVIERAVEVARVVEVTIEPEPFNPIVGVVVTVIAVVVLLIVAGVRYASPSHLSTTRTEQHIQICEETCKASCPDPELAVLRSHCERDCDVACRAQP